MYCDGGRDRDERRDCAVRAFATAWEIPYYQAYDIFEWGGRRPNHGVRLATFQRLFKSLGMTRCENLEGITVNQFCKGGYKGQYLITVSGHALCVKDSVVFDKAPTKRARTCYIWQIPQSRG